MEPKIIAFHLPQFHSIPENDLWWGKGFTEWFATKKASPLFKGHHQPRIPLQNNYYDLLNKKSLIWQANLAKKYGIYGFCFYHYWFCGKKLLEKPAEKILANKDINIKFCFCWANQSWERTWYGSKKEVLMKQEYGEVYEWKKHFFYLLKFFKDPRYIKIDGKPVFTIYNTRDMKNIDKMISYWNSLSKENGLNGIFIIEVLGILQGKSFANSDAITYSEPGYTLKNDLNIFKRLTIYLKRKIQKKLPNKYFLNKIDYRKIWSKILNRKSYIHKNKKIYLGGFVDFDSTARKKNESFIMKNHGPKEFSIYIDKLFNKSKNLNSEYIFINAWNEWAEGNYLEPDFKNNYEYLEAIKRLYM